MLNPEEHQGEWWRPEEPTHRIHGTLRFADDAFDLTLSGPLFEATITPGVSRPIGTWEDVPVVHGLVGSTEMTLLGVQGFSFGFPDAIVTEVWHTDVALIGGHVDADTLYDHVAIGTEHLEEFAQAPFPHPAVARSSDGTLEKIVLALERAVVISEAIEGQGTVELTLEPSLHTAGHSAEAALDGRLTFTPEAPFDRDAAFATAMTMRDLVRLATCCRCALTSVMLRRAVDSAPIRFLRRTTALGHERCEGGRRGRLLFGALSLPAGASPIGRWWSMRAHYLPAFGLLTSLDDAQAPYVGERFALFARAIETLHSLDLPPPTLAGEERDERVARVLAVVPGDLYDWAQRRLEGSSPPKFRHQVMEVIAALGPAGLRLCGGNPEGFAAAVTTTRNAVTHPTQKLGRAALDTHGQFWVGSALYWIGHGYLALNLGIAAEDLDARLGLLPQSGELADRMAQRFSG